MLQDKTVGVLGGIGPESSARFYFQLIKRIQKRFQISSTADYPHIILNSISVKELVHQNVTIDDINPILEGLKLLDLHHPDFNIIICNSAYSYYDYLSNNSRTYLLDLKQLVYDYLFANNLRRIGVLGTHLSISKGYSFKEIDCLSVTKENQIIIDELIVKQNKGKISVNDKMKLNLIICDLMNKGVDVVVLACTELGLICIDTKNTIDPMNLLLDEVIRKLEDSIGS